MQIQDSSAIIRIVAGRVFNSETLEFAENQVITISQETGLIHDVQPLKDVHDIDYADRTSTIDLRGSTVLPGFVDVHVHRRIPRSLPSTTRD